MERLKPGPDTKEKLIRAGFVVLFILASAFGIKAVAGALADLDNRDLGASSAGIPSQESSGLMNLRDQRVKAQEVQTAQDKAESEALRQKLNPKPDFP